MSSHMLSSAAWKNRVSFGFVTRYISLGRGSDYAIGTLYALRERYDPEIHA